MAIYDTMQFIKNDVTTICVGQCASMGALLFTAGAAGKRFALPNVAYLDPPAVGRCSGTGDRRSLDGRRDHSYAELTSHIIAKHTGQTFDRSKSTSNATVSSRPSRQRNTA